MNEWMNEWPQTPAYLTPRYVSFTLVCKAKGKLKKIEAYVFENKGEKTNSHFSFVGREELRIPLKAPAQAQDYMGGEDTFDLKRMNAVV